METEMRTPALWAFVKYQRHSFSPVWSLPMRSMPLVPELEAARANLEVVSSVKLLG